MREIFRKYARFLVISCTIIVVQTNSITTDFWRKPWVNTVAYFPFENDQNDKYWTALIQWTWTKQTLWYRFNSTWKFSITNVSSSYFVCYRVNFGAKKSWTDQSITLWSCWELLYNYQHQQTWFNQRFSYMPSNNNWNASTNQFSPTQWTRYFIAFWYDWTKVQVYVNAVKVREITSSIYNNNRRDIGSNIDQTISKLIYETQMRQESDIVKFFNKTKSIYWY